MLTVIHQEDCHGRIVEHRFEASVRVGKAAPKLYVFVQVEPSGIHISIGLIVSAAHLNYAVHTI